MIARRFTSLNADTALLAGLLQCIGKLYLLTRAARYPSLLEDDAALERIGSEYHLRVAQAILRNWDMDAEIIKAIGACENFEREHAGAIDLTDVLTASAALIALGPEPQLGAGAISRHARRAPAGTGCRGVRGGAGRVPRRDRRTTTGAQRMSQAETTSTIESRAIPNTVVFGFVKALALELSQGRVDLPSVPDIVLKMQRALADENVSNETVVKVLGSEPVLASKLLNMANSAALNTSGRKIADLRMAVARVGFNIVRSAALSFAVEQLKSAAQFKHLEPMLDALWKHSVHVAALSHVVARRFTSLNGDTALLAGLMHNVGRIYILTRASAPSVAVRRPAHLSVHRARLAHQRGQGAAGELAGGR